ncbi:hypothetical protein F0U44_16415 [Nocardioides humilatus]|uniref:Uncharacterized protein n=1 Tax=Nocardioides humilatus TaxID=2607660 RepID=A0A5B1LAR3_9ACTN|nr:hypothetical protein [Nocardioides humilatus]KAA1416779.1 hypothetical protein F0U44_16415 [Nocardioides humilatus]
MKRSTPTLIAVLLGSAVVPYPDGPAAASCAGPTLSIVPDTAIPRGTSTVAGRHFNDGCNDVGSCTVGCSRHCDEPEPVEPLDDVELRLVQRGRTWTLGTVDADGSGDVSWTIEVPSTARPGPATLVTDQTRPVRVVLR